MDLPEEPHPGVKLDICPMSGAVSTCPSTAISRRSLLVPEAILRSLRDRSRDSYQKFRDLPQRTSAALSGPFQYAATPAVPLIHSITSIATSKGRPMDEGVCEGPVVASGPGGKSAAMLALLSTPQNIGCMGTPGVRCVDDLKSRAKVLLENIQVSIVVRNGSQTQQTQQKPTQQTLRIKNNKTGHCVYQVTTTAAGEELHPIDSLKHLFPHSKHLRNSLTNWNRHFQKPPQHWIINFIPRAYLRRGYSLSEEIYDYLLQYSDGCKYRIEYEPIGHEPCLVGNIVPRAMKTRERNPSRYWEAREKVVIEG